MNKEPEKIVAPVMFFGGVVGGTIVEIKASSQPAEEIIDNFSYVEPWVLLDRTIKQERTMRHMARLMRRVEPNPYRTTDNIII
jgi:hypothetical protein